MAKSAYPTQSDLNSFLTAAGVTVGTLDTATAVQAGIEDFERRTRRKLLAPGSTEIRYYDPPTNAERYVELGRDLATLTSVVYQPEGGSAEVLVVNTDYRPTPYNAAGDGKPMLGLELYRTWVAPLPAALRRSLQVTGRWGYGTTIPEDAWLAILQRGASLLLPSYGLDISEGRDLVEDTSGTRRWGADPLSGARRASDAAYAAAVRRYRRPGL